MKMTKKKVLIVLILAVLLVLSSKVLWNEGTKTVTIEESTYREIPKVTPSPTVKPIQKAAEMIQYIYRDYSDCKVGYSEENNAIYLIDSTMDKAQNVYNITKDLEYWDLMTNFYVDISSDILQGYDFVIGNSKAELMFIIKDEVVKYDWARDKDNSINKFYISDLKYKN